MAAAADESDRNAISRALRQLANAGRIERVSASSTGQWPSWRDRRDPVAPHSTPVRGLLSDCDDRANLQQDRQRVFPHPSHRFDRYGAIG
jgi:hypothetical protein